LVTLGKGALLVTDFERLGQLRGLIRRLEALPTSPARDALLAQARDRVVTLETGGGEANAWQAFRRRQQASKPVVRRRVARPRPSADNLAIWQELREPTSLLIEPEDRV
jgi:hypothetical protein